VLQRELLIRARSGFTFLLRSGTASVGMCAVAAIWGFQEAGPAGNAELGLRIFKTLLYLLVAIGLMEGVRSSALSIVEERTEGTLGLLFLTDLGSRDILAGKVGGHALSSVFSLLAAAPLLALPLLLGGVSGTLCLAGVCVALNALLLALACGTLASVWCRKGVSAVAVAYGMVLLVVLSKVVLAPLNAVFGGFVLAFVSRLIEFANPVVAIGHLTAGNIRPGPGLDPLFWTAQAVLFLASLGILARSAEVLERTWLEENDAVSKTDRAPKANIDDLLNALGRRFSALSRYVPPPANPLSRSLAARLNINRWLPLLMLLTVAALFAHGYSQAAAHTQEGTYESRVVAGLLLAAGQLLFAFVAVQTFAEGRHTGEMEILMTTPLEDRELVNALWYLLRRIIGWTVSAALAAKLFVVTGLALWGDESIFLMRDALALSLVGALFDVVTLALLLEATAWLGMWLGLRTRRMTVAVAKTFGWMTVAPVLLGTGISQLVWARLEHAAGSTWSGRWSFARDPHAVFNSHASGNLVVCVIAIAVILHVRSRLFGRFRRTIGEG
jgi:ABC-type transport system involved in multi-copper enzyme maturation permease subunit